MNYLCIDYGLKHTGIAIATTPLAEPLRTVPTSQLLTLLPSLVTTHQIQHLIIGLPDGRLHDQVKHVANSLQTTLKLPLTLHDETLSSQEAKSKLLTFKHKTRSGPNHHFAAALILQDYLDATLV